MACIPADPREDRCPRGPEPVLLACRGDDDEREEVPEARRHVGPVRVLACTAADIGDSCRHRREQQHCAIGSPTRASLPCNLKASVPVQGLEHSFGMSWAPSCLFEF